MAEERELTTVQIDVETRDLLRRIADMELRSMGQQLKMMVRRQAEQMGLVQAAAGQMALPYEEGK